MSEQLKQEVDTAEIDRLETETDVDSKTIGQDETELPESKLEDESGNEVKAEDTVYLGKASLTEILTGMADPTEEEIRAAEIENAKPVKQKAKEKLEAEKKKATQKNFADPIIAYLLKRCEEDQGFAKDVMQEGKTWSKCFNYIIEQARKQSNGRSAYVEDSVVYEWAEDEAKKKMKTITKDELIAAARQCFKVYQSYIGLRNRYDSLKAAIDILRDQNTGFLQTIKEIERLYEAASKEQGITAKYSTEWKEFERYTDALPQEAWIQ